MEVVVIFRSLLLAGFTLCSLSVEAEVSKQFLLKMHSKFKSNMGLPLRASEFRNLTDEENEFVQKTEGKFYEDIFRDTLPKDEDLSDYNFLNFRGARHALTERRLNVETECKMVRVDETAEGRTFTVRKIKVFRTPRDDSRSYWKFSYCTGVDKNADKDSIVYYFHGVGGNPANFIGRDATYALRERWREMGQLPQWVAVSMGTIGHLGEKNKEQRFFDVVVPYIEKKLGFKERPKNRFGFGVSQGGANVVHSVVKREGFFDAAVAVCPAVVAVEPFSSEEDLAAYRKRTNAMQFLITVAFKLVPREFLDHDYWFRNVDAFMLGQKYLNENSTPLYIQTSSEDQLGLQEGGRLFAMLARTLGAPVMFEELKGGHCVLRPRKIADFFMTFQKGELPLQLKMLGRTRR